MESPAKAKTIQHYLGADYAVVASMGHVVDLPDKGMGIDIAGWFVPTYEVDTGKKPIVNALKKAATSMRVVLATDEDREGEAIARHIARELWLDQKKTPRIVFHEITKQALQDAIAHPRQLDLALVDAQQARRVLDRLVGYELSPVLWRKIKTGLSAGRVQSVAVKLVVDREREIMQFAQTAWFAVSGHFITQDGSVFQAKYAQQVDTKNRAHELLAWWKGGTFLVDAVTKKPWTRSPSVPFTTSSLQQEASRKLGYSVSRTMQLAQRLYEAGHITYMRTDSISLSAQAMGMIGWYVTKKFGASYHQARKFQTKNASAQEAHEAIRPTVIDKEWAGEDDAQKKLYHLIWQRTVASQMSGAKIEKTEISLLPTRGETSIPFVATGEVVVFEGFLRVYGWWKEQEDGDENQQLPTVAVGDLIDYETIIAAETVSKPPARFTEAMLVKAMEENGIGRPSTYAPTIQTIQQRGYVERRDRAGTETALQEIVLKKTTITEKSVKKFLGGYKGRLVPTDIGMVVNDFLTEHFPHIIDEQFTASVEQEFDDIAENKLQRQQMIKKFYTPFHQTVEQVTETAERASGERVLWTDAQSGKVVKVRIGRFGPLVQIGESDDPDKQFASIPSGYHIETITLDQAMKAFDLPRLLWEREEKEIKANTGRFGPYVQWWSTFASLPKGGDPMTVTYDEAVLLLEAKRKKDEENTLATYMIDGKEAIVKKWRWWYFVSYKRKKIALPRGIDTKTIDEQMIRALLWNEWWTTQKKKSSTSKSSPKSSKAPTTKAKKRTTAKKTTSSSKKKG